MFFPFFHKIRVLYLHPHTMDAGASDSSVLSLVGDVDLGADREPGMMMKLRSGRRVRGKASLPRLPSFPEVSGISDDDEPPAVGENWAPRITRRGVPTPTGEASIQQADSATAFAPLPLRHSGVSDLLGEARLTDVAPLQLGEVVHADSAGATCKLRISDRPATKCARKQLLDT